MNRRVISREKSFLQSTAEMGQWEYSQGVQVFVGRINLPAIIPTVSVTVEDVAELYRGVLKIICSDLVVVRKVLMSSAVGIGSLLEHLVHLVHRAGAFSGVLPPSCGNLFVIHVHAWQLVKDMTSATFSSSSHTLTNLFHFSPTSGSPFLFSGHGSHLALLAAFSMLAAIRQPRCSFLT